MIENLTATHLGISVMKMKRSVEWYQKVLGFTVVKDIGFLPSLCAHICFIERSGFQLELFEYINPKPGSEINMHPNEDLQTVGTKHLAFLVDDMDAAKQHLAACNVPLVHEVQMGGDHVVFIHDCDGILIELICPPK